MSVNHQTGFDVKAKGAGFALIEILVAVSVLAISLVVILQLFSGGLKSRKISEAYTRGIFYGREKMGEILVSSELPEGESDGEFEDKYRWKTRIERVVPEEGINNFSVNLMDIQVSVSWFEGEKEKSFVIRTLKIAETEKKLAGPS